MPSRIFFGQNLTQLKATLTSLQGDLRSGGVEELTVAGVRTRMGAASQADRENLIFQCRLEGYRVAKALDAADPNKAAALADWPDPRKEHITRVETRHC